MGTSTCALKQRRQSFVLLLAMALAMASQALSAQTEGALTLVNKLSQGLILYHPPGCCSPFSGFHPPPPGYGCARCPMVWLYPNVPNTLDPIVGPYPLQYLQFMGNGGVYCMKGRNLLATNTVTIGPKECGEGEQGIEAQVEVTGKPQELVVKFCMGKCG